MHDDFFDEIIRARETGAVDFTPILWARCLSLTVLRSRRTTVLLDTHSLSSQVLRKSFLRARPSAGTPRREAPHGTPGELGAVLVTGVSVTLIRKGSAIFSLVVLSQSMPVPHLGFFTVAEVGRMPRHTPSS